MKVITKDNTSNSKSLATKFKNYIPLIILKLLMKRVKSSMWEKIHHKTYLYSLFIFMFI